MATASVRLGLSGDTQMEATSSDAGVSRVGPCLLGPQLGAGGAAAVHVATLLEDRPWAPAGTRVALKLLHPSSRLAPRAVARLQREAAVGMRIEHPAVVRTFEVGTHAMGEHELHYVLLEYLEGQTLLELVREHGPLPEPLLRDIAWQVAHGLEAIHAAGAIHRDVKPTNVMITPDHQVKLMDLGMAHLLDVDDRLTASGLFLGTVEYASPEQVDSRELTFATDLYSLGVTLYEAATGTNPFAEGHYLAVLQRHLTHVPRRAGQLNPHLSPFFEELLATLLEKNPEKRLGSAGELAEVLEAGESSPWWREREATLRAAGSALPVRLHGLRESPFVGRQSELDLLRSFWSEACASRGSVVLLEGEAGLGKSRLVEELVRELARENEHLQVLYGYYIPGAVGVPAGALAHALLRHFGTARLEAELLERVPVMAAVVPQVAALFTGDSSAPAASPPSPEAVQEVFSRVAVSLADERPTLWVVEDLHHATADDRSQLLALARAARDRRLMVVATTRPGLPAGEISSVTRLEHARHVQLGPLADDDIASLIQRHVLWRAIAEEVGARVARKADGHPYFALEILRDLRTRGLLAPPAPGSGHRIASIEVPSTVRELLLGRLAELPTEHRKVLDLAAVQGFEIDVDLLARVRNQPRLRVLEILAEIERNHRLVHATGGGFRFDHHLLQETIYEAMLPALRREHHKAFASGFAARQKSENGPAPPAADIFLAQHFLRGEDAEHALPHVLPALDHLGRLYQHEALLELAEMALGALRDAHPRTACDVLLRQARAYEIVGMRNELRTAAVEAFDIAERLGDAERRIQTGLRLAAADLASGALAAARERLGACLEAAAAADKRRLLADGLLLSGSLELVRGDMPASRWAYDRLAEVAQQLGDRQLEGQALARSANVMLSAGHHVEATQRLQAGVSVFRETGARQDEALAMAILGVAYRHGHRCRYDQARQHLVASLSACREIAYRHGELLALTNLAVLDLEEGNPTAASSRAGELQLLVDAAGAPLFEGYAILLRGESERALEHPVAAEELLAAALRHFRQHEMLRGTSEAAFALGRLRLEKGDRGHALPLLEEAAGLVDLHRLDEPGPLPAAWLAYAGERDPRAVVVDRGPTLLRGEAHLMLHLATGDASQLAAAEREISAVAATLAPTTAETFWRQQPAARRLRETMIGTRPSSHPGGT